jgi:hypothetical protein
VLFLKKGSGFQVPGSNREKEEVGAGAGIGSMSSAMCFT